MHKFFNFSVASKLEYLSSQKKIGILKLLFSKKVLKFTRGYARIRYRGKTKSVARAPQHCTIHNATNFTIYPQ